MTLSRWGRDCLVYSFFLLTLSFFAKRSIAYLLLKILIILPQAFDNFLAWGSAPFFLGNFFWI